MGVLALSLFTALLGALLAQLLLITSYGSTVSGGSLATTGAVLGLLMGLAVGMVLINIVESAVAMVFVSFAEDPLALETHHKEEFDNLLSKWRVAHPTTVEWVQPQSIVFVNSGNGGSLNDDQQQGGYRAPSFDNL
jgi:hypothetical protein